MKLVRTWICAVVVVTMGGAVAAGDLSLIGTHPTSSLTPFPAIFALKAHEGRIYMGYGDWNQYPIAVVASYDPASNAFRLEYSAPTDALDNFQSIGSRLYAPSIDPIHYEGFQDYSVREGGRWRSFTPGGLLHAFQMGTANGSDLWMTGSKLPSETPTSGGVVMRSVDGGRSWLDVSPSAPPVRYHYGVPLRGRFFVQGGVYDGNGFSPAPLTHEFYYRATALGSGTNEFAVGLTGRIPGFSDVTSRPLTSFDGANWRTINPSVVNFTVNHGVLYALSSNLILRANSLSASQAVWEALPLSSITNARSIEVQGGIVYVGDAAGRLWSGNVDGSPLEQAGANIINEMPDSFGRALTVSGDIMVIGAPDFSGGQYLCGRVAVWEQTEGSWEFRNFIDPPQPAFSGWFGKDVALDGTFLAILESGRDTSGVSRGSAAAVHLYWRSAAGWQLRQTLTHPFAHSVALNGQRLAVATETTLYLYSLPANDSTVATLERTIPQSSSGYEPIGRVALDGDRLAFGLAGDISRNGGPGQVSVYERNAGAWVGAGVLRRDTPPLPSNLQQHPDAFGFAVSLNNGWLAIGAPRDDSVAAQAGAVHLFQRIQLPTGATNVLRQTLISPVAQPEARFGAAVSLNGTRLIVGAPGANAAGRQQGRVFAYEQRGLDWISLGELPPPTDADGEFGWEVLATADRLFASGRSTGLRTNLEDRISILPIPASSATADLSVTHTASPSVISNGSPTTHWITLTNEGPSTATRIQLVFNTSGGLHIESVSAQGLDCTNSGAEVRCTTMELAADEGVSLEIVGQANLPGLCGRIETEAVAFSRELDPNGGNNRASAALSSEPPNVALITPADGAQIPYLGSVPITAAVSSVSQVFSVSFYTNNVLLRSLLKPPYSFVWASAPPGHYQITARVVDECGVSHESETRLATVASNLLPQVTLLSPVAGTRFSGADPIPIYVSASDPDGVVVSVGLLRNLIPIRQFSRPPYYYAWSNAPLGSHVISAAAFDNHGGAVTSHFARITIGPEPTSGTNWIAYNDHAPGPGTRNTVTRWDIQGTAPGPGGWLRNAASNATLPVWLTISRAWALFYAEPGVAPQPGSPAATAFNGYVDFATGPTANIGIGAGGWVRFNFAGLDPNLRYSFKGASVRGLPEYTNRWTLVELSGARAFDPAHTAGCLTNSPLARHQVALNTGFNLAGDMVNWTNIQPARDGTLVVNCLPYLGPVPNGSSDGEIAYALTAISLEEIGQPVSPSPIFVSQPASITTSPGAAAAFSVAATSQGPLTYQWLRNQIAVTGANTDAFVLDAVSTNDVGVYAVIIADELGGAISEQAVLTLLTLDIQPQSMGERSFRLNVFGPVGQRYDLQRIDALSPLAAWSSATNLILTTNRFTFLDPISQNHTSRFYRVVPLP